MLEKNEMSGYSQVLGFSDNGFGFGNANGSACTNVPCQLQNVLWTILANK